MQFKTQLRLSVVASSAALVSLLSAPAMANGGHFLVDDADITPPGECQLETWFQRASAGAQDRVDQPSASHVWVAQPACSTANGWEIAAPLEFSTSDSELAAYGLEVKTMLSTDFMGGALAVSAGVMRDHQVNDFEGGFINLPFTTTLTDVVTLHVNAGAEYDNFDSEWNPTWGVAATFAMPNGMEFITETAGVGSDSPAAAIGLRSALGAQTELDVSFGRDFEVRSNIASIGLSIAF
jgi:hypothetical protein